ncbi:MAG TPA: peptidoglycan bridge formation glycyltransferase FemA/FemB family protein [Anaerolineae bacterium]
MWQPITDPQTWNTLLCRLPAPHVLQSWEWGEFKSRWGWSAERWALSGADQRPRALVQLLRRRAGRLPVCVLYAPKGPVVADAQALDEALSFIERRARQTRAVWAKVDGDCHLAFAPRSADAPQSAVEPQSADALTTREVARSALRTRGWRYSPNQVQFRNTMHTDLRHSDDELLAGMKQKWRYNIRLAEKHGVTIRQSTPAEAATLYRLYGETGRRDGFTIREPDYYYDAWRSMHAVGLLAEHASVAQPLAGLVLFRLGGRAWYFYGMSSAEGREHMPNYLLQWAALRWARDNGCTIYDWWGAPEELNEHDSMWGVYRFKDGFGAKFVEGLGAWDYAPSAVLYSLYTRWMPAFWRMARRKKSAPQNGMIPPG